MSWDWRLGEGGSAATIPRNRREPREQRRAVKTGLAREKKLTNLPDILIGKQSLPELRLSHAPHPPTLLLVVVRVVR